MPQTQRAQWRAALLPLLLVVVGAAHSTNNNHLDGAHGEQNDGVSSAARSMLQSQQRRELPELPHLQQNLSPEQQQHQLSPEQRRLNIGGEGCMQTSDPAVLNPYYWTDSLHCPDWCGPGRDLIFRVSHPCVEDGCPADAMEVTGMHSVVTCTVSGCNDQCIKGGVASSSCDTTCPSDLTHPETACMALCPVSSSHDDEPKDESSSNEEGSLVYFGAKYNHEMYATTAQVQQQRIPLTTFLPDFQLTYTVGQVSGQGNCTVVSNCPQNRKLQVQAPSNSDKGKLKSNTNAFYKGSYKKTFRRLLQEAFSNAASSLSSSSAVGGLRRRGLQDSPTLGSGGGKMIDYGEIASPTRAPTGQSPPPPSSSSSYTFIDLEVDIKEDSIVGNLILIVWTGYVVYSTPDNRPVSSDELFQVILNANYDIYVRDFVNTIPNSVFEQVTDVTVKQVGPPPPPPMPTFAPAVPAPVTQESAPAPVMTPMLPPAPSPVIDSVEGDDGSGGDDGGGFEGSNGSGCSGGGKGKNMNNCGDDDDDDDDGGKGKSKYSGSGGGSGSGYTYIYPGN